MMPPTCRSAQLEESSDGQLPIDSSFFPLRRHSNETSQMSRATHRWRHGELHCSRQPAEKQKKKRGIKHTPYTILQKQVSLFSRNASHRRKIIPSFKQTQMATKKRRCTFSFQKATLSPPKCEYLRKILQ